MEYFKKILVLRTLLAIMGLGLAPAAVAQLSDSGDGLVCEHIVTNDWGSGFTAVMRLTNAGDAVITDWRVCWEYARDVNVNHIWNIGDFIIDPYCATGSAWNSTIYPGQSVEFGFMGTRPPGAPPEVEITVCEGVSQ